MTLVVVEAHRRVEEMAKTSLVVTGKALEEEHDTHSSHGSMISSMYLADLEVKEDELLEDMAQSPESLALAVFAAATC